MFDKLFNEKTLPKILISLLLVLIAVFSATFLAGKATSVDSYTYTISSIDQKKATVTALTASSTLASTLVSAIPDDTATPIAEKLADLSEYFLVVLIVLYAEKYLLTIIGGIAFKFLIPLACLFAIIYVYTKKNNIRNIAAKLAVFGLLFCFIIPLSIKVSDTIYTIYESSINETIESAEQISEDAASVADGDTSIWAVISGAATNLKDTASKILSNFVEALAVMIVTSCIIPLLLLLFFVWMMKKFWGIVIPMPGRHHHIPQSAHVNEGAAETNE